MFPVRIETERLVIREFSSNDLNQIYAYASDPDVVKYMIWGPNTLEVTATNLAMRHVHARAEPRVDYDLAIAFKTSNELIGAGGIRIKSEGTADMGYALTKAYWGNGYIAEAMAAMLAFGFERLGLHRIWATTDTRNRQSQRVLEKLGMRREALFEKSDRRRGEWTDSYLYAILESDWSARARRAAPASKTRPASIRRATRDDFAAITSVYAELDDLHRAARPDLFRAVEVPPRSRENIQALLDDTSTLVLLAEAASNHAPIGLAIALDKNVAEQSVMLSRRYVLLDALVVTTGQRRTGVAGQLLHEIEGWARVRGATSVELGVHDFNAGARAFYERSGYVTQWRKLEKRL